MTRLATLIATIALMTAPGASAQESAAKFTINPVMAKGPATAPVTIVEFSDYQ